MKVGHADPDSAWSTLREAASEGLQVAKRKILEVRAATPGQGGIDEGPAGAWSISQAEAEAIGGSSANIVRLKLLNVTIK
jgi:hypothetical protein